MRLDAGWSRQHWQLVAVERDDDRIVLDVLELGDVRRGQPSGIATIELRGAVPGDLHTIGDRLERWLHRADGICEAYRRESPARGCLALFQDADALVVETAIH